MELNDASTGEHHLRLEAHFAGFTPAALYEHWTDAGKLTLWWPQEAAVEARSGGHYRLAWPGAGYVLRGRVLEARPGERFSFTWAWEHEPGRPERTVALDFRPTAHGTLLSLEHGTYRSNDEDRLERQGHREGWEHFLPRLAALSPGAAR